VVANVVKSLDAVDGVEELEVEVLAEPVIQEVVVVQL